MNSTDMPSRFGFHSLPFTREIRVADRFAHELYERPREYLRRAVDKRMSGALIAPAGTGKTLLLRALSETLPEARYRVRYRKAWNNKRRFILDCRMVEVLAAAGPVLSPPVATRDDVEGLADFEHGLHRCFEEQDGAGEHHLGEVEEVLELEGVEDFEFHFLGE